MDKITITAPDVTAAMVESENLIVRQARALVIETDEDYAAAGELLQVAQAGLAEVGKLFDEHCRLADQAHKKLTGARERYAAPWKRAIEMIKAGAGAYYLRKKETEKRLADEARAKAEKLERDRQEAEARAAREDAQRRADAARLAAEAEAEKLRNAALELEADHKAGKCAGLPGCAHCRAERLEVEAAVEAERIETEGNETAEAIRSEPVAVVVPAPAADKLKSSGISSVAVPWKCDRTEWDPTAFAGWVGENPAERGHLIKEPDWSALDKRAKAQGSKFDVRGIKAGPVAEVRGKK